MIKINPVNNVYSILDWDDEEEFMELYKYFQIEDPSEAYSPRVRAGLDDGLTSFIERTGQFLWGIRNKIINTCAILNIDCSVEIPDHVMKIDDETWKWFLSKLDLPYSLRDYQELGSKICIEDKRRVILSPTRSGKSLIIYIIMRWFIYNDINALLIVPDVGLVLQMYGDFEEYTFKYEKAVEAKLNEVYKEEHVTKLQRKLDSIRQNRLDLNFDKPFEETYYKIYAGQEKFTDHQIKISTIQSIYDKGPTGMFENTKAVLVDETHKQKADSYVVLNKYIDAEYKLGFSGTMNPDLHDQLIVEGLMGPAIRILTVREMIERGYAVDASIQPIYMMYSDEERKLFRSYKPENEEKPRKMSWQEQEKFILNHEGRRQFVIKFLKSIASNKGNTIALFKNKKIQKEIYEEIKKVHKNTFIINGDVKAEERDVIRKQIDSLTDALIIGTDKILSTGLTIKSLRNMVFAQVNKAEIGTIQSIGRVLGLFEGKDQSMVWDLVDDLVYTTRNGNEFDNYAMKHHKERINAYHKYEYVVNPPKRVRLASTLF